MGIINYLIIILKVWETRKKNLKNKSKNHKSKRKRRIKRIKIKINNSNHRKNKLLRKISGGDPERECRNKSFRVPRDIAGRVTEASFRSPEVAEVKVEWSRPLEVGDVLGAVVGLVVGAVVGAVVGEVVGDVVGLVVGDVVGEVDGEVVGEVEGAVVGEVVGEVVGHVIGDVVGEVVGDVVGSEVGELVGEVVGDVDGDVDVVSFHIFIPEINCCTVSSVLISVLVREVHEGGELSCVCGCLWFCACSFSS